MLRQEHRSMALDVSQLRMALNTLNCRFLKVGEMRYGRIEPAGLKVLLFPDPDLDKEVRVR